MKRIVSRGGQPLPTEGSRVEIKLHQILPMFGITYTSGILVPLDPPPPAKLDFLVGGRGRFGGLNIENLNSLHDIEDNIDRMMRLADQRYLSFYTMDEAIERCLKALVKTT